MRSRRAHLAVLGADDDVSGVPEARTLELRDQPPELVVHELGGGRVGVGGGVGGGGARCGDTGLGGRGQMESTCHGKYPSLAPPSPGKTITPIEVQSAGGAIPQVQAPSPSTHLHSGDHGGQERAAGVGVAAGRSLLSHRHRLRAGEVAELGLDHVRVSLGG